MHTRCLVKSPREMGKCNGVNLMNMEPWFGYKLRVEVVKVGGR
jgi:hypothetical protein